MKKINLKEILEGLGFFATLVFFVLVWGSVADPYQITDVGKMAAKPMCWVIIITIMMITAFLINPNN